MRDKVANDVLIEGKHLLFSRIVYARAKIVRIVAWLLSIKTNYTEKRAFLKQNKTKLNKIKRFSERWVGNKERQPPKGCFHFEKNIKGCCRGNVEGRRHLIIFYCNARKNPQKLTLYHYQNLLATLLLVDKKHI